jgi:lipid-A-disaccharide synthase-like uncharacterized protein
MTNSTADIMWLTIGFIAQGVFTMRFVVQWLYSEFHKKSMIPTAFWYLSISGSLMLLLYAIHKRDPVFILGQSFGSLVYLRNLYFIHKKEDKKNK